MKKHQRVLLFILLFGTMLIFGIIENIKGVSYPLIKSEYNASYEQQGFMVSALSAAYVGFSVIAGIFLGRFGIKPSYLFGFAALSTGLFAVFFSSGFFLTGAALFVIFAGFGFFEVGINALASRLFVKKAALLMNMLHALYGVGAVIGPRMAGLITNNAGLGWRYVYLFSLPLALVLFIPTIFTKFPESGADVDTAGANETKDTRSGGSGRKSFFEALKSPIVWLLSVTLGLAIIVEMNNSNWGPLYFQDVYGFDPVTSGAAFLSAFFLVFTLSRLICGFFVEKIGYMQTLLGVSFIVLLIYFVGFFIGERGIYVLPALGFFLALLWPTIMAVAIQCFGRDAPVCSSVMIAVGGLINAAVQYLVGLTNKIIGPAWGYRSTIVYNALLIVVLFLLYRMLKKQEHRKTV